jgi:hypothetical protein
MNGAQMGSTEHVRGLWGHALGVQVHSASYGVCSPMQGVGGWWVVGVEGGVGAGL